MTKNKIAMRKTVVILSILALLSYNLHSQTKEYEADKAAITNFLLKHCSFEEPNPTHQEEADRVNFFVRKIFEKQYTSDDIPNLITQTLQLFYDNSIGEHEDDIDGVRITIKRSMCYMALAFLSDDYRYPAFLEDARENLNKLEPYRNGEMLLIVNMVELYSYLSWERYSKRDIKVKVSQYKDDLKNIKNRENYISDNFIAEYNRILLGVEQAIGEIDK